jgi:MerR family copper efflux transcriptional regulator
MLFSIGQLAEATGETVKTLRYWTDLGLLRTERGENNYRYYSPEMERRVTFIRSTQALGFSLTDIVNILALREESVQPCGEVREKLLLHLAKVRGRLGVAWVWWTPKRLSYHAQPERCSHAKESSPIS